MAQLLGKLVRFEPRTLRLAEIIRTWLAESSERRILVLSERKEHLARFEALLQDTGAPIGYYIGGMKEEVREDAGRNAQVLLASYAMASEAMNIKSLNTVLLASPRKKVEQSVGRILRERPEQRKVMPIILDVIDSHGVYQGQWRKRRAFYKACGYKMTFEVYGAEEESSEDDEAIESQDQTPSGGCCIIDE